MKVALVMLAVALLAALLLPRVENAERQAAAARTELREVRLQSDLIAHRIQEIEKEKARRLQEDLARAERLNPQ